MDLVWVRLYQSGFRQGLSWLNFLFKHMQAISWVWCICFTVKNEQNWERDFNKYILLSLCLDETSLRRNWVWWLKEKDGEKEREGERELCGTKLQCLETPGKRLRVCFQLCVCVCVCARVSAAYWCAEQSAGWGRRRERENVLPEAVSPRLFFCAHEERTQRVIFLILHQIMSKINLFL